MASLAPSTGIVKIVKYDPTVFLAYNPVVISFVYTNGIILTGGVRLAVAGVEVPFSDLGDYNR